jgi:hypothetical protein
MSAPTQKSLDSMILDDVKMYHPGSGKYHKWVCLISSDAAKSKAERLKHSLQDGESKRTISAHVFVASQPWEQLDEHNREKCRKNRRSTKHGSPFWKLEYLLGPFHKGSHRVKEFVVKGSRGLASKIARAKAIRDAFQRLLGVRAGFQIQNGNYSQ